MQKIFTVAKNVQSLFALTWNHCSSLIVVMRRLIVVFPICMLHDSKHFPCYALNLNKYGCRNIVDISTVDLYLQSHNKTDVERRRTLAPLRSINPNMTNHFIKLTPLLFSNSYTCCLYIKLYRFRNRIISDVKMKKLSKRCQSLVGSVVDIHGSVAFSILPIEYRNILYR